MLGARLPLELCERRHHLALVQVMLAHDAARQHWRGGLCASKRLNFEWMRGPRTFEKNDPERTMHC
jgi:hypothetical protein